MIERKLASIQRVIEIKPIEGADNIELAKVLGWHVIIKKGEFYPGELGVFFEIDSILPERGWAEFLRKNDFHVKTYKLNKFGVISQGLLLPIHELLPPYDPFGQEWTEGDDVTDYLDVTKYEAPITFNTETKGSFHPFIPKTDELRIQSFPVLLEHLKGKPYYITEKLDGTSCTVVKDDTGVHVYSRNLEVGEGSVYYRVLQDQGILEVIEANPCFALQGEIVGEGIQKNRLGLTGRKFFLYNIYDLNKFTYLDLEEFMDKSEAWNVETVPLLAYDSDFTMSIEELEEYAKGQYQSGHPREGIVVRPAKTTFTPLGRLSFKVINVDFLLKVKE
jgi:RNA ligase (TIGR02306 family)